MEPRIYPRYILTKSLYERLLKNVEELIEIDPEPGTEDSKLLESYVHIVESHEKEVFKFDKPSKLSKIIFRLSQKYNQPWMERFL